MGRVFVAGSINMDVVATAERHPQVGETVAGKAVLYFPGGKGANQAVAAAKLGAPATLIGRLGRGRLRAGIADVSRRAGRRPRLRQGHGRGSYRNGAHHHRQRRQHHRRRARRQRACQRAGCRAAVLAKGDVAVSQFEIPLPAIAAFFQRARAAGATTILNPAPAIKFGRELLDLVDILVLNETELGLLDRDRASRYRR